MPRENRKRGKKHKKTKKEDLYDQKVSQEPQVVEPERAENGEPSWIRPAAREQDEINPEAPFGYVDADVKAYFRTVDVQIRDWQDNAVVPEEENEDTDPNEERRLFFVAALNEMRDKEKQLATDPDCSVIMERMAHSMDDFVRRVFVDSLVGSFELLFKHRFASHVVQTLFMIAKETINRETKGIYPSVREEDSGELRTLAQLILDICDEILPKLSDLVLDPFGSHVVRALMLLLSPNASVETEDAMLRSKKSTNWKAKQGSMKSVFQDNKGKQREDSRRQVPAEFTAMATKIIQELRGRLGGNEVRAMAASKVASPCLKVLLGVEADLELSDEPDSLLDQVTMGIVTFTHSDSEELPEASDFVGTLLRDPTSSHLLETIVLRSPDTAFDALWRLYFKGSLARLAIHPVANFVAAKAIERATPAHLEDVASELETTWNKMIRTSRTGVLRAFIDRVASLEVEGDQVKQAVLSAFDVEASEPVFVLCILSLLTFEDYKRASETSKMENASENHSNPKHGYQGPDPLSFKTQGSILLQLLLKLPNSFIVEGLRHLSVEDKIRISHDASASRVYDVLLDSPTIQAKDKREFVMSFIGHYHELVDDRIGSRVGDRCWAFCDTYLKEKIARSLISYESQLAGSFYGKYFARNTNIHLLKRKPEEWRTAQSQRKSQTTAYQQSGKPTVSAAPAAGIQAADKPTKRKRAKNDEIEELFDHALGKRIKKAALGDPNAATKEIEPKANGKAALSEDASLAAVFGAIRSAPKNEDSGRKHKKKKNA
ncbi:ARM repeat-containing protein [Coprinopsis marcescibilis]|uniref:Nucleolar protein 9 n=1 Tax=Coprinopsis marcescibilis TaxID=230819 RepID=A0A5C3L815_COPMA|nr:ARM repeat-containing protein [Coprinopsis marcescibilis]